MPLSPHTRLGPYEITAAIGAGGMGEVYRARDTRLDRTVAIKILPKHISANPQARERFQREARAVSSLNHPHICTLHDVGHQDGIDYLVMEYLEGETLAHRIKKGPLPPDQVLRCAIEIAEALDTAHRHNVIHRDLKPDNIILTKSGTKLLDFGLAKVRTAEAVASVSLVPTEITPLTAEGTILGTLQYMAPEQLEGKEADARTDIFALGVVLYEMATGRKAFEGKSKASLIAAILQREPAPISSLQPMAPPALDHVVRTCMAKDPEARWQTVHDVLVELKWITEVGPQAVPAVPTVVRGRRREVVGWLLALGASLVAATLGVIHFREKPPDVHPVRFRVPTQGRSDLLVVSPDGRRLVFTGATPEGNRVLWMHSLDAGSTEPLAGTEEAGLPFWSPDSRFVAFFSSGKLKKIDTLGGPPQTICDVATTYLSGGSWGQGGVIVFGERATPLYHVSAGGGEPQPVMDSDKSRQGTAYWWPHFLPDGVHFLYESVSADARERAILVGSLNSTQTQLLIHGASKPSYVKPGFLIYSRQGTILAQKFDAKTLRVTGPPVPIAGQVDTSGDYPGAQFSASEGGVLAYRGESGRVQLAWRDRDGKRLAPISEPGFYPQIALSPDEKRLAVQRSDGETEHLWLLELATGIFSKLTFNRAGDVNPVWSPDGRELVYSSIRNGHGDLYRKPVGGGEGEAVYQSDDEKGPFHWSKDGFVLFLGGDRNFYRVPLAGERRPVPALKSEFPKDMASVSRDERWVAYQSTQSGQTEVYVAAYPSFSGGRQVSNAGGCQPLWRADGKELFYLTLSGKLAAVEVKGGTTLETSAPHVLFQPPVVLNPNLAEYCVTSDGKKFIFREPVRESSPITVVLNWTAGLKH